MDTTPEMTSAALVELLRLLDEAALTVWLDGGWGVDALLGTQSRRHKDVDVILRVADVPRLQEVLGRRGFAVREGKPPDSFVLADRRGLEVDVHAVVFDGDGNGVYRMQNGEDWVYPAEGFSGRGVVDGLPVRCLSPAAQVLCHAHGYTPVEKDRRDMALLQARFGLALPPHLRQGPAASRRTRARPPSARRMVDLARPRWYHSTGKASILKAARANALPETGRGGGHIALLAPESLCRCGCADQQRTKGVEMSTTVRAVGAGLFFVLIFLSGFWLSHSGKPYNGIIFNIHKLIGLAAGVFLGVVVYQVHRAAPLGPAQVAALVVAVLLTVATVAAGGLASLSTPMPAAFLTLHRLLPYLTTLSIAATLYLLLSRKM